MNVELLQRVRDKMAKYATVEMDEWFEECGTAGCIAGEACLLTGWSACRIGPLFYEVLKAGVPAPGTVYEVAREELGLNTSEANRLFYIDDWPREHEDEYREGSTRAATLRRIDRFIASEGRE